MELNHYYTVKISRVVAECLENCANFRHMWICCRAQTWESKRMWPGFSHDVLFHKL